jgi:hypothetical protein
MFIIDAGCLWRYQACQYAGMKRDAAGVTQSKGQLLDGHGNSSIPWPAAARSAKAHASLGFIPR